MELREFAEQILFATTLEEKLASPDILVDERPGLALDMPPMPGRPPGLAFKPSGSNRSDFPGLNRLEQESERGRLLHFFANHELLATELMALVLLRFPEAPASFRRGVLQTLREEQEHIRLYLKRMRECGIEFGALPVSGYFWRAVSPMNSPLDFVTGISLTFEQANLDFSKHYARAFTAVGDTQTAELLDRIYHDEIAHVAHGLKWFRRWKEAGVGDWQAFCQQLKYPLSPQRAKGIDLNVEGRRAAGFDPEFIAALNVFSQSRGRTPSVFVFNPFTEGFLALGPRFTPVRDQTLLAADLASLPQFLACPDDVVLVPSRPSIAFLSDLKNAGFPPPEFVELESENPGPPAALMDRKLGGLRPWAWGPDSLKLLGPLSSKLGSSQGGRETGFHPRIIPLYSKAWSAGFLRMFLTDLEPTGWLCTTADTGTVVDTLEEALAAVDAIRKRGHHKVVVKESFGLAGRNMIRLWEPQLLASQKAWISGALAKGHPLVVEPWLDRVVDFSVHWEMGSDGLVLRGFTGLVTDARGQFQANWAEPSHRRRPPATVLKYFPPQIGSQTGLLRLYESLRTRLEPELQRVLYQGPVGIDAFVYQSADGVTRLKPVVEINPRYTMGRLTLELMRRVAPGAVGTFRLLSTKEVIAAGFESFKDFSEGWVRRFPVHLGGSPLPKIQEGAICLNDPVEARVCLALFQVSSALVPNPHLPCTPAPLSSSDHPWTSKAPRTHPVQTSNNHANLDPIP